MKNIEIIYVDNNSTDDTINIIQKIQKRDKRIILLKNKGNKGPFYSRNKGVIFSKGEYIQFIDSDDMLFGNNTLEKAYQVAKAFDLDVVQYKLIAKFKKKIWLFNRKIKKYYCISTRIKWFNVLWYWKIRKNKSFYHE